ncbi:O-methyltransferase [Brevibacterium album]|uniref:O-methyltransferase n=1 Tax=Brevibacterium album TaxID=417948 RepID=UPI0004187305|nr:class I SAM-dependent methyltransferase [Brevibacterium album]
MGRDWAASARMADDYNGSDPVDDAARSIAHEFRRRALPPTSTAALTFLTQLLRPASAIEVGTGTGTATLALLRGMPRSGILTSIDTDGDAQQVARELLVHAGLAGHRVRMITGEPVTVLGRLAQRAYDLVLVDAEAEQTADLVPHALQRLEPGGVLVISRALQGGDVADPAVRTPQAKALRTLLQTLAEAPGLSRVLLPVDDGLLILRLQEDPSRGS